MSQGIGQSIYGRGAAVIAAALTLAVPGIAQAQQQQPNAAPQRLVPVTAGASRYATPDGSVRFVLDRSGGRAALVQFEGDPEVHVLRPTMGAGGDEIFQSENGDVRLRVTSHGGITVYTRANRTGAAASEEGRVAPLTPEELAFAEMQARFRSIQNRARRSIGQPVLFTVPAQMTPLAAGVVTDAAERAAEGLTEAPLTNVRHVIIVIGRAPAVALRGDTLLIQVAPQLGYAGRPSSSAIRNVVMGQVQGPEQ
ncbi:DUF4908 domain-containing protein [Candidatus Viadribacter manganicus]|nr:DUF4908 domain-containing protein [Candidatus Viadribacter manganicus]